MDKQTAYNLILKYLDAGTTLDEESALRDYFTSNNNVPEDLKQYTVLFKYFDTAKSQEFNQPIDLPQKRTTFSWVGMAASVLILLGTFIGYQQQKADALLAFEQTQSAFNLLSSNLNKGTESIAYLGEFDRATNKLFKE